MSASRMPGRVRRTVVGARAAAKPPPPEDGGRTLSALVDLWKACAHAEANRVPQVVVERVAHALSAHSASLLLRETGGDTLRMAAGVGLPQELVQSVTLLVGERIAGRVAATGIPIHVSGDPRRHPLLAESGQEISPRSDVVSALCVPLTDATGHVLGVLSVSRHRPAPEFAPSDLSVATLFAAYAGACLAEARLRHELAAKVEAYGALERLAASVAHEMRNPVAAIKGAAQYVRGRLPDGDILGRDFLTLVVDESDSLERLASDLIEWARPSQPNRSHRDLVALIRGQISLLSSEFESLSVAVRLCGDHIAPAWVDIDPYAIGRAVRNLLLNAAQASSVTERVERPAVSISICASTRGALSGYEVIVDDNGVGVPRERRLAIWEPFVTDKARGVGLGLAQVRSAVESHGGDCACVDSPMGGARFVFFLPASSASDIEPALPDYEDRS